ncbi:glycosyltransferase [Dermatobacter hominis]|uniref:glycosyltransferase n=1 Tax=Dermatobacter hominis TaxID=2884263 RepID=UPI001D10F972|nr:glycosyltransferase [Dermatobacter hominis]UDY37476.1 glycosyltransferase [Dermatobacter hominis]
MTGGPAVGVVIPARDEEAVVAAAVSSVRRSLAAAGVVRSCIVVVADDCRDGTVAAARAALGCSGEVLEVGHRCVGAARQEGSARALRRLGARPEACWLLSIDADSSAPADWVTRHLAHASAGIECVAGVVDLVRGTPAPLRRAFHRRYGLDGRSEGRHHHVHGTNLGIRGDTLLAAGGWPSSATGEDHGLWDAVGALGRWRVQDAAIVVRTSGRLVGRAPLGFARDLRLLVGSGEVELGGDVVELGEPHRRAAVARRPPIAPG